MQRGALLDAARTLLSEGETEALTFPALAERTGLARSSVYEYFRSRAAVVEELCAVDFPVWAAEVEAAMAGADTAEEKIEAYVRRQLALVGDRRHRAVVAISAGELDAGAREKIRAAHGGLIAMIVEALADLGHEQPRLAAMLLQGIVDAAVRRIELGAAESPTRSRRRRWRWSSAASEAEAPPGGPPPRPASHHPHIRWPRSPQPAARSPQPAARSPQPAARSPQPAARSPQPAARSPQPAARSPQPAARSPQPAARSPQPAARSPQPAARSPQPAARSPQPAARSPQCPGAAVGGCRPQGRLGQPSPTSERWGHSYLSLPLVRAYAPGDGQGPGTGFLGCGALASPRLRPAHRCGDKRRMAQRAAAVRATVASRAAFVRVPAVVAEVWTEFSGRTASVRLRGRGTPKIGSKCEWLPWSIDGGSSDSGFRYSFPRRRPQWRHGPRQ